MVNSMEVVIKCTVDQIEKMTPVTLNVPSGNSLTGGVQIQVPQVSSWRLHERFRWPHDQVLLISRGMVAMPGLRAESTNPLSLDDTVRTGSSGRPADSGLQGGTGRVGRRRGGGGSSRPRELSRPLLELGRILRLGLSLFRGVDFPSAIVPLTHVRQDALRHFVSVSTSVDRVTRIQAWWAMTRTVGRSAQGSTVWGAIGAWLD